MKNLFKTCLFLAVIMIPQISHSSNFTLLNNEGAQKEIKLEGDLMGNSTLELFSGNLFWQQ